MIEKMTRYDFILLKGEEEEFLLKLQELGVVDVNRSSRPVDSDSLAMVARAEELQKAIRLLEAQPSGIRTSAGQDVDDPVSEAFRLRGIIADLDRSAGELRKEVSEKEAWGAFDKSSLEALEKAGFRIRFYSCSRKAFDPALGEKYALQVIQETDKNVWFVTIADDSEYSFPMNECRRPEGDVVEARERLASVEAELKETEGRLAGLAAYIPQVRKEYASCMEGLDRYLARKESENGVEDHVVMFEGFAPSEDDARLEEAFGQMDLLWFKDEAKVEDNPPIKLRSNRFTKMFAVLTDMYGRPEYNGFDPTPYISVFFLLFFGFCMGDLGYGLVLIVAGILMNRMASFRSMAPLVTVLGIGTSLIGLFFHTFFSMDMLTWECIPEAVKNCMLPSKFNLMGSEYDGTMVLAILVGIFHLCVAMVVKTIYATKQKGFANSLGTWGWTLLIVGGVIVAGVALTGVLDSAVTKWIIIALGSISALGIFILNDLHRNPLKNIGAGLWETYNTATGLLGDVLSYLRLYALGLAGAMLGQAFNTLGWGLAEGGSIGGWIGFIIVVLIGHVLNIAMAALGAFVHPLRLNFLEFFKNSGYETSGRDYAPLTKTE